MTERIPDDELEYRQKVENIRKTIAETAKLRAETEELRHNRIQRWWAMGLTAIGIVAGAWVTYFKAGGS